MGDWLLYYAVIAAAGGLAVADEAWWRGRKGAR